MLAAWRQRSPCRGRPRPPPWSAPAGRHGSRWDTSLLGLRDETDSRQTENEMNYLFFECRNKWGGLVEVYIELEALRQISINCKTNHFLNWIIFQMSKYLNYLNKLLSVGCLFKTPNFTPKQAQLFSGRRPATPTCLESGLEDVWWNGDGPVEDSGHPASKQDAGNAEFVVAAGGTEARELRAAVSQNQQTGSGLTPFTFSLAEWGGSSATRKRWSTFHWQARLRTKHGTRRYFSGTKWTKWHLKKTDESPLQFLIRQ